MGNRKITVRQATWEDLPGILEVENMAWPERLRATLQVFESRLRTFPEGTLVAEVGGKIQGVVVTQKVTSQVAQRGSSWSEATDGGYLENTHNPTGDTFYGVNLSVSRLAPRGVAAALLETVGKRAILKNIKQITLGARIPGLRRFLEAQKSGRKFYRLSQKQKDEIVKDYIERSARGRKSLDPELCFYKKANMQVMRLLPNYIEDPDSLNYGVLLTWKNPFYGCVLRRLWSWRFRLGQ